MRNRMLLKAILVAAMGVASLTTGKRAQAATSGFCYTCYHADTCPDEVEAGALCYSIGGDLCPVPDTCVELAFECRYYGDQWMLITCQAAP